MFRVDGRSTPIMGIDRSRLSCRTLLFLFVLLGTPLAARSATLEDSARELARNIAAMLPANGELSCEIRNISSLNPDDVVRIEQTLKTELQGRCVRIQPNGSEAAGVVVTLSENVKGLMWTAEIQQGTGHREILQAVPQSPVSSMAVKALPIVLRAERFWDGPERILDAGSAAAPDGDRLVILLLADAVLIQNANTNSESRIDIPLAIPTSTLREPSGKLSLQDGNILVAVHGRRNCAISLESDALVQCEDNQGETTAADGRPVPGGQVVPAPANCTHGSGIPWFVTGTGDDTQPDYLEVKVSQNLGATIASNRVNFPGPVLAIHGALSDASNTVIVRNLQTGNYEAYRLSISCGQ